MQIFTKIHVMDSAASGLAQYMYTGETQLLRWLALFFAAAELQKCIRLVFFATPQKKKWNFQQRESKRYI
jgi:hypothetical protein